MGSIAKYGRLCKAEHLPVFCDIHSSVYRRTTSRNMLVIVLRMKHQNPWCSID